MEIAEYNSQQAKVKPESDAVSKRLDGIKDRLAKKSDH
jgi:hypothetical protein